MLLAVMMMPVLLALASGASAAEAPAVDFRYAPPNWQTCIGLPDDWQKTLVGKDGALLYDYPGPLGQFNTRITAGLAGDAAGWVSQELLSPRVPVITTRTRRDGLECLTEAFAAPSSKPATASRFAVERVGSDTTNTGWASPSVPCDPAFADIAVGWKESIRYRFPAEKGTAYAVVLGLCEGYHPAAGRRILDLQIEGKTRKTVDPFAEKGRNVPMAFAFHSTDDDGDGAIDVTVAAAAGSPDVNTILNVLWVFRAGQLPPAEEVLTGRHNLTALAYVPCGSGISGPPRDDLLLLHLANKGPAAVAAAARLTIESTQPITPQPDNRRVLIGGRTIVVCAEPFVRSESAGGKLTLLFAETSMPAGGSKELAFGVHRGSGDALVPASVDEARALRAQAESYWREAPLPYDRIQVPDAGVQALIDSSIRNIYQAREIKKGLPAFQVGPTCYRGLWVVDGSFLLEAAAYLGRTREARHGIEYLLSFQRDDGGFMLIDQHWKETGIVLWAVTRHARLTGDKEWLATVWPRLERGLEFIRGMRKQASADPQAPVAGLIPVGFSDGGLSGPAPEYTNVYWTLAGLRAAADAARWLGKPDVGRWQREYDDLYAAFRRAAERDMRDDGKGHRYVPIFMTNNADILPQRGQWAFLHAVFPGQVFPLGDSLVQGNMAMLRATECEGLVLTTGWLDDGLWNYFGSFYAHAWLWLGDREKAVETLYAFANHASPLLVWREEHRPLGRGDQFVGDMPHNWASAEFIRLVRHLLVLERGSDLHLLEGLPAAWVRPGARTRITEVPTQFGPVTMELQADAAGKSAVLKLTPPARTPPGRIVLHLDGWTTRGGTQELPATGAIERTIRLREE